MKKPSIIFI